MSSYDESGTAFPETRPGGYGTTAGLTKREYFAAAILSGMMSRGPVCEHTAAKTAVIFADALLQRLDGGE